MEAGLDLVEIQPKRAAASLQDPGLWAATNIRRRKKAAETRKKQKTVEIKEIKMRPNIDTHDYEVKMKNMLAVLQRRRQGQGGHSGSGAVKWPTRISA